VIARQQYRVISAQSNLSAFSVAEFDSIAPFSAAANRVLPPLRRKGITMSAAVAFKSPYEIRVELVKNVVKDNTALDEKSSVALAISVLRAIDHIPEKIR
jgi:hypothetical protein